MAFYDKSHKYFTLTWKFAIHTLRILCLFTETGCSSDPCSNQYKGSAAMSEPEMQAVKAAAEPLQGRLKLFLTLHSYSQLFLSVYGYNYNKYPDNHQEHVS